MPEQETAVLPAPTIATTHVVWLSGGKDSTAMALRLAEVQPETEWRFVCTPTGNELPDVYDHWERMGELLGKPLERVTHPLGLTGLMEAQQMLPSHAARWCTRMLKIQTALAWYAKHAPCVAYVGLRADEPEREGLFGSKVPQRYPMREWGVGFAGSAELPATARGEGSDADGLRLVLRPKPAGLVGVVEAIPGHF